MKDERSFDVCRRELAQIAKHKGVDGWLNQQKFRIGRQYFRQDSPIHTFTPALFLNR